MRAEQKRKWLHVLLGVVLLVVALWAAQIGTLEIGTGKTVSILLARFGIPWQPVTFTDVEAAVVWNIRLPRVLLGIVVGAGISTAGAAMQGLFRNPLADPGLIGVSAGGAMGAILGILFSGQVGGIPPAVAVWTLPLFAMGGGVVTTGLVYRLSLIRGRTHVSIMLLTGIAVNALSGAVIGAALYLSSGDELRRFVFWTLGSLSSASWSSLGATALFVLPGLVILPGFARSLNLFLIGEAEAWHLGVDTQKSKRVLIFCAAMMVGACVASSGMIGFIGLVVPHVVRLILGPDHRGLLPGAALLGGSLLLLADAAARTIDPPSEVPIGILTALLGAPFFLALLQRRKHQSTI